MCLVLLAACNPPAQNQSSGQTGAAETGATAGSTAPATPTANLSPAQQAYRQANERMHASMSMDVPANPDVAFAQGMIPHHRGAIDMARVQLQYGTDPEMRRLAEDVIRTQEAEIAQLNAFLAKRGAMAPAAPAQGAVDHSAMGH